MGGVGGRQGGGASLGLVVASGPHLQPTRGSRVPPLDFCSKRTLSPWKGGAGVMETRGPVAIGETAAVPARPPLLAETVG